MSTGRTGGTNGETRDGSLDGVGEEEDRGREPSTIDGLVEGAVEVWRSTDVESDLAGGTGTEGEVGWASSYHRPAVSFYLLFLSVFLLLYLCLTSFIQLYVSFFFLLVLHHDHDHDYYDGSARIGLRYKTDRQTTDGGGTHALPF